MSDMWHKDIPIDYIDTVFAVMLLTDRHTYQLLTKRAHCMGRYFDCGALKRIHCLLKDGKISERGYLSPENRRRGTHDQRGRKGISALEITGSRDQEGCSPGYVPSDTMRVDDPHRVSDGIGEGEPCDVSLLGSPASVDISPRTHTSRSDDQPQKRRQSRQSNREPGIGDYERACLLYTSPSPRDS